MRADWLKTLRYVGTIDGVEFYEMSRINPEKSDFAAREKAKVLGWPVSKRLVTRIGDGVTDSRPGSGRPHKGVDVFAPAGSDVIAVRSGRVKRVIDGRNSRNENAQRAGSGSMWKRRADKSTATCTWVKPRLRRTAGSAWRCNRCHRERA